MSTPISSLRAIEYELHGVTSKTPEHEKQRLIALTAISHLGGIGCLIKHFSLAKICTDVSPIEMEIAMRERLIRLSSPWATFRPASRPGPKLRSRRCARRSPTKAEVRNEDGKTDQRAAGRGNDRAGGQDHSGGQSRDG